MGGRAAAGLRRASDSHRFIANLPVISLPVSANQAWLPHPEAQFYPALAKCVKEEKVPGVTPAPAKAPAALFSGFPPHRPAGQPVDRKRGRSCSAAVVVMICEGQAFWPPEGSRELAEVSGAGVPCALGGQFVQFHILFCAARPGPILAHAGFDQASPDFRLIVSLAGLPEGFG